MNRVQGDSFETLLYKLFISLDAHTTLADVSALLQVDLPTAVVGGRAMRMRVCIGGCMYVCMYVCVSLSLCCSLVSGRSETLTHARGTLARSVAVLPPRLCVQGHRGAAASGSGRPAPVVGRHGRAPGEPTAVRPRARPAVMAHAGLLC
jgi:hypothetical protein